MPTMTPRKLVAITALALVGISAAPGSAVILRRSAVVSSSAARSPDELAGLAINALARADVRRGQLVRRARRVLPERAEAAGEIAAIGHLDDRVDRLSGDEAVQQAPAAQRAAL